MPRFEEEPIIKGKVDNGKHDGMYATVRHLAETDQEIVEFWEEQKDLDIQKENSDTISPSE